MVLFYTIIFSYWPSESCENFSCSENISFIIHLSAVYLNIRLNAKIVTIVSILYSIKYQYCYAIFIFDFLSNICRPLRLVRVFIVITSTEWQKSFFFTFIAICPRFYFITPVSTSTRRREKTISSNVKKRVNKYVSIFSRDVVWVWY